MRTILEQRLAALRAEYEAGQKMLAELEQRQAQLQTTMLRISGAIQVIEEVLKEEAPTELAEQGSGQ